MRRRARFVSPLLAIGLALILAVVPALAHPGDRSPGGPVTDDPSQLSDQVGGLDGLGLANVEQTLGNQPPASVSQNKSRNVTLVGSLKLAPFNEGVHADVAGYKNLAFIGKWRGACPGTGVDIIDISNPAVPAKLSD